ncbi:hypothetical protein [uncultured Lamprocystis sp.]|uniref:hypothetical protein n=1 Tax=uncultured Lamprocystis sp. TaxID=543132 RepID=UPI0025DADE5F|nr:hypothetical protein [uncultured Lamprocystis sp.]
MHAAILLGAEWRLETAPFVRRHADPLHALVSSTARGGLPEGRPARNRSGYLERERDRVAQLTLVEEARAVRGL